MVFFHILYNHLKYLLQFSSDLQACFFLTSFLFLWKQLKNYNSICYYNSFMCNINFNPMLLISKICVRVCVCVFQRKGIGRNSFSKQWAVWNIGCLFCWLDLLLTRLCTQSEQSSLMQPSICWQFLGSLNFRTAEVSFPSLCFFFFFPQQLLVHHTFVASYGCLNFEVCRGITF